MAAVKGKKGRRPSIHLLQEPQAAAARPTSASCSAWSSASVGGPRDWVGSFHRHKTQISHQLFYASAQVASDCLGEVFFKVKKRKENQC